MQPWLYRACGPEKLCCLKKGNVIITVNIDLILQSIALEGLCCAFKAVNVSWHLGTVLQEDRDVCFITKRAD